MKGSSFQPQHQQHHYQPEQRSDIAEAVDRACAANGLQSATEAEIAEMTVSEVRFLATSPSVRWKPLPPFPRAFLHPQISEMQVYQYTSPNSLPSFATTNAGISLFVFFHCFVFFSFLPIQ